MFSAEELYGKLREVENLIRKNTNADGTFKFDPQRVMIALELARKMAEGTEPQK